MRMFALSLISLLALVSSACSKPDSKRPPVSKSAVVAAATPSAISSASAAPVSTAAPQVSEKPCPLPKHPLLDKLIADDCTDPRVVLAARATHAEAAAWVQQFLVANPEFKVT